MKEVEKDKLKMEILEDIKDCMSFDFIKMGYSLSKEKLEEKIVDYKIKSSLDEALNEDKN